MTVENKDSTMLLAGCSMKLVFPVPTLAHFFLNPEISFKKAGLHLGIQGLTDVA